MQRSAQTRCNPLGRKTRRVRLEAIEEELANPVSFRVAPRSGPAYGTTAVAARPFSEKTSMEHGLTRRALLVGPLASLVLLRAARGAPECGDDPGETPVRDIHSYANPLQVRVTHVALDLEVDFASERLKGTAELHVCRRAGWPADVPLPLDTFGLDIQRVTAGAAKADCVEVPHELGKS